MSCTSIKGWVLVDLVAKFAKTPFEEKVEKQNMDGKSVGMVSLQEPLPWRVHVIISPEKIIIEKSLRLGFSATNNETEYEALLVGTTIVQRMGGKAVKMFSNSRLVVGQVEGELEARDLRM